MAIQFPSLKPTGRNFKLGTFPTKTYRALSGATVKRSFGNKAFGYEINLQFTGISDADVVTLLTHYNNTKAGFERFTLPASLFAGMSTSLQSLIQAPTNILWEYAEAPSVESLPCDLSTVTIRLIGELD